jgi:hypothetical protein
LVEKFHNPHPLRDWSIFRKTGSGFAVKKRAHPR